MQISLKGVYCWNKLWPLKNLVTLKCESRTNLHAVQYKWQAGSGLMPCPCYFRNGYPRHFVLMFCGAESLVFFLAYLNFFNQNQGFCSYKIVLIKQRV